MKKYTKTLLLALLTASILLTACSSPTTASPTNTQAQISTTVAPSVTPLPPTNTPLPTNTTAPTATKAPTQTPLPTEATTVTQAALATATPATPTNPPSTSGAPVAHVNENTNCRSGPSSDYSPIVVLLSGQDVKIVSRTTLDDYLLVENPENPPETCWLWTQFVTTSGDLASLPVATPPPPLVSYNLAFTRVLPCTGYTLEIKVLNTGEKTIQAYTVVAKDLTSHTQQTTSSPVFDLLEGCVIAQAIGYIDPGKVGYIYANYFPYDPTGHVIEADVTICSHNDMTGACVTQVYTFTP